MATPRTVKPRELYFSWSSISQGISMRQGVHQVAQKFTSTTLPRYWFKETSWPCRSFCQNHREQKGSQRPNDHQQLFHSRLHVSIYFQISLRRIPETPAVLLPARSGLLQPQNYVVQET